jgi:DNA-binding transcriptional MocR family regulator
VSRRDRKGRADRLPPFVPLLKATLASPAWRAMSHGARSLYVSLKARYNSGQHNNGRVFVSQRTASQEIGSSYAEIARWFRELQYYGFLVQTKGGSLGLNGKGTAPHWRLTECGYMNDPPTRDFGRWDGTKFKDCVSRRRRPKTQNPVAENRNTPLRKTATPALRKTATPSGTSVAENRNMVEPPSVAENRNISSLPLPSAKEDLWQHLDIPACLRRRV